MTRPADPDIPTLTRAAYFPDGFPLAMTRIHRHNRCAMHAHEFSELVVVLRGMGLHTTPDEDWPLAAGDVFVLHGGQAHGYEDTENLDLVNILFDAEELGLPTADVAALPGYHALFTLEPLWRERDRFESRLRLAPDDLRQVATLIDRLEHELSAKPPGWRFAGTATLMLIIADLSRCYARVETAAALPLQRLGRVISHLEQHYAEPLTLDDLAATAHLSRRHLSRVFHQAMGCTPVEYLVRLRLNRAVELLETTDLPIATVGAEVGYVDSNYFARQFRAILGRSPRAYRAGK